MEVIFIAVNYNNSRVTESYIQNISKINKNNLILIVDNASYDKELRYLINVVEKYPNVTLISNKDNLGYFKGLNSGINYVKDNNIPYDYIVVGNNDLEFAGDFLEKLEECRLDESVLAIAPNVYTDDGIYQNPHVISRVSRIRKLFYSLFFVNYNLGNTMYLLYQKIKTPHKQSTLVNEEMDIYMGIGAIYILTRNFMERCKNLDDRVFLWGEEALLGNQIKSVDGVIRYIPGLKVRHLESLTTSKIPSKTKYAQMKESYKIYKYYL